jgi:hypothetical protein
MPSENKSEGLTRLEEAERRKREAAQRLTDDRLQAEGCLAIANYCEFAAGISSDWWGRYLHQLAIEWEAEAASRLERGIVELDDPETAGVAHSNLGVETISIGDPSADLPRAC